MAFLSTIAGRLRSSQAKGRSQQSPQHAPSVGVPLWLWVAELGFVGSVEQAENSERSRSHTVLHADRTASHTGTRGGAATSAGCSSETSHRIPIRLVAVTRYE